MKDTPVTDTDEGRAYHMFLVSLGAVIVLLFSGIFLGVGIRNTSLVHEIILERGRSLFQQIVLTRLWAAQYGGVYVRKGPGVESNPWLEHPDLEAADGSLLTLRNPALITREISEIAALQDDYHFRITSLKPLNPGNAPDDFERRALEAFESGALESWDTIEGPDGRVFRYMGALNTESSCLVCHAVQGYQEGDVRGGISVGFTVEQVQKELHRNALLIMVAAALISALTLAVIYIFVTKLRHELGRLRQELQIAASTDALTGLYNRRYAMERFTQETNKAIRSGMPLACAILDADDFKALNDRHGHPVGDMALKAVAVAMKETIRVYDTPSRYGGEEFLILFPGLDRTGATVVCDRLRLAIARNTAAVLPEGTAVTVSIGLADLASASRELSVTTGQTVHLETSQPDYTEASHTRRQPSGAKQDVPAIIETMLKHADSALYKAKARGKDCCVAYADPS
ncbi:MAG: diguanylate cyclase [Spirochaetia bacterium]|nr:diguanylate cyclase [Spirochaetia bacterium]